MIGEYRGEFETNMNWNMVRGERWVVCIPNYGVYGKGGQWGGEEEVGLRSSNQARPEGGLGIVLEALNFEKKSSPKIRSGAF